MPCGRFFSARLSPKGKVAIKGCSAEGRKGGRPRVACEPTINVAMFQGRLEVGFPTKIPFSKTRGIGVRGEGEGCDNHVQCL